ncbi:methyltransferase domain-containing protein [Clostridium butyricum]|uniref:class I SAM-dependent methyltransferase n=1 Tax=Clostridium butyricum TaxID=1492 RepID=UPI0034655EA2
MSCIRFYPVKKDSSYYEHFHRYLFAKELLKGKKVLDISCGEGYGTHIMSSVAKEIVGCDIDEKIVESAKNKYIEKNLEYRVGDCTNIPFEDGLFDTVVSFETIEHFAEHEKFISEVKRVLNDNGFFIVSTPDKTVYSDERNYHNEDHVRELTKKQFSDFLKLNFKYVKLYGEKFTRHSIVIEEGKENDLLRPIRVENDIDFKPMYIIAICSDKPINIEVGNTIFGDGDSDQEFITATLSIKELEEQVKAARIAISQKDKEINKARKVIEGKNNEIESARKVISQKDDEIKAAGKVISEKTNGIERLEITILEKDKKIEEKNSELEEKNSELEEKNRLLEKKNEEINLLISNPFLALKKKFLNKQNKK